MIITSKLLEKMLQIFREWRVIKLFTSKITQRIPGFIFESNHHHWLLRYLDKEEVEIEPKIPVAINFLKPDINKTFDWIKKINFLWGLYKREKEVAIKEGHYWLTARSNGEIIGFIKFGFGKVFVSDYNEILQFPPNVVFLYEIYVAREFRNKGVASYLINETCKLCKEKGYNKILTYIHSYNHPSLKSFGNAGFRIIKRIYYFKIFDITFLTANPADL